MSGFLNNCDKQCKGSKIEGDYEKKTIWLYSVF